MGQRRAAGQKAVGPTSAAIVGPTDVPTLARCWPNVSMLSGEVIESYFYEPELQIAYIDSDEIYKIEKILQKRKRNRISEVLVKWKGWPDKFNSWIPESDLQDIN